MTTVEIGVFSTEYVIFGAGSGGKGLLKSLRERKIRCFIDNDPSKWGDTIDGVPVQSPRSVLYWARQDFRIIVASQYYDEIRLQLESEGFVEGYHFWDGFFDEKAHNEFVRISRDEKDISRQLQRNALRQTSEFVEEYMIQAKSFPDRFALLDYALEHAHGKGLYMEFGVFKGITINYLAEKVQSKVYGFDSFEGLPEDWRDGYGAGTFKVMALPVVRENVTLLPGWFEETLAEFTKTHSQRASFIHVDCDLYSSTKTIFRELADKIASGTVLVFDEFFNYPGWKQGEYKAFMEFVEEHHKEYEFLGYHRFGEQVAVRIL